MPRPNQILTVITAEQREAVERSASNLMRVVRSFNLAEWEAQKHAQEAVLGLLEIARDKTNEPETRRKAYNDILDRAYGKPMMNARIEKATPDSDEETFKTIEAVADAAGRLEEMNHFLQRPVSEWPEWMKEQFGEGGVSVYSESPS